MSCTALWRFLLPAIGGLGLVASLPQSLDARPATVNPVVPSAIPQSVSLVYSTDLLDDPAYGDLDDYYDLPLVLSGATGTPLAAIILDRGWIDPLPGLGIGASQRVAVPAVSRLQAVYGREVPLIVGSGRPFSLEGASPPAAARLRHTILDNSPVVIIATGTLRDLAWALQSDPRLTDHIKAVWIFAGDADPAAQETWMAEVGRADWNAAADPAALAFVVGSGLDIYWFPVFDGGVWTNQGDAAWYQVPQGELLAEAPSQVTGLLMEEWASRRQQAASDSQERAEDLVAQFSSELKNMWVSGLLLQIDPVSGAFVSIPGIATTTPVSVAIDSQGFFVDGPITVNRLDVLNKEAYAATIASLHARALAENRADLEW